MKTNDIVNAISLKLNFIYNEEINVYTEQVEQGFEEPCFFIKLVNPNEKPLLGNRYLREYLFDIHYFGKTNEERNNISDDLLEGMEYIELLDGDSLRGFKMHSEIVDDVLHFFVTYKPIVYKDKPVVDYMEEVTIWQKVK